MGVNSRFLRITGLSVAVAVAAFVVVANALADPPRTTRVGDASVALGDDTGRSVEQVAYRQDVVRVGDVVVVDGAPRTPLSDPDVVAMWEIVERIAGCDSPDRIVNSLRCFARGSSGRVSL